MIDVSHEMEAGARVTVPAHGGSQLREARVVLERNRYSWIWVVSACPYCGKAHDHYAGPLDGDPTIYLGMRYAAHCAEHDRRRIAVECPTESLSYVLVADAVVRASRRGDARPML